MLFSQFIYSKSLKISFFIVISAAVSTNAEQHKCYKDQFLVEYKTMSALSAESNTDVAEMKSFDRYTLIKRNAPNLMSYAQSSFTEAQEVDNCDTSYCDNLIKSGVARTCAPNYQIKLDQTPNDPLFSSLWGLDDGAGIDAPTAWDVTTGSDDVVVAVIDTGVLYTHPDLSDNIWVNPGEISGNSIDDDGNGYVDDVHGINVVSGTGKPLDDNGHGTHVAGTIGARGNNSTGVVGVNWNVKIMALKFLGSDGSGSLAGAVEAIDYMVSMKNQGINVRVSNNSWGGGGYTTALYQAISDANDAGILFVAAAGNEANDNDSSDSYPASYDVDNVISVAAIDSNKNLAYFSNYGATTVDIAAPGVDIYSTYLGNTYEYLSGTSMATPHVAGALGLLFAAEPSLSISEAKTRLYESGVELSSLSGVVRTGRTLNVGRMVTNETSPVTEPVIAPTLSKIAITRTASGRKLKSIKPGKSFRISLRGSGSGDLTLKTYLNGKRCSDTATVSLSGGTKVVKATMPTSARGLKKLKISASRKSSSAPVENSKISKKRFSGSDIASVCTQLVASYK